MKRARIVIGANYGDEGKGTVVATLTKHNENVLNILTNGGAQRGHSIVTEDGSITFQHFGSGTYHGADNYYSKHFILNPIQFVKEYNSLIVKPKNIFRDYYCRWSTPYDVMANIISEQQKKRHASCCMGIWNTIKRTKETGWLPFDWFINADLPIKLLNLRRVKEYYERNMNIPDDWKEVWNSPGIFDHFIEDCKFVDQHTTMCGYTKDLNELKTYDNYIFENGQGLLLCDTGKDTFDTTPSNTGIEYSLGILEKLQVDEITADYVTRPYLTRHGDGHLSQETNRGNISSFVEADRTNHRNDYQGDFRYGMLDISTLKDRVLKDARGVNLELHVTHCDEMDRVEEFKKAFGTVNTYENPLII